MCSRLLLISVRLCVQVVQALGAINSHPNVLSRHNSSQGMLVTTRCMTLIKSRTTTLLQVG